MALPLDPALLAAVLDAPDDDGVRLVAADWWEEHGETERAEFIRVQYKVAQSRCLIFKPDPDKCPCGHCALRHRERELWLANRHIWGDIPGPLGDATNELGWWWRGFVERCETTLAQWLRHGPAMVRQAPLREVWVVDKIPHPTWRKSDRKAVRTWWRNGDAPPASCIPMPIWRHVLLNKTPESEWKVRFDRISVVDFDTRMEAEACLSQACLIWAKLVAAPVSRTV